MSRPRPVPAPEPVTALEAFLAGRLSVGVAELAGALGCSRDSIERELARGHLEFVRVGSRRLPTADGVRRWYGEHRNDIRPSGAGRRAARALGQERSAGLKSSGNEAPERQGASTTRAAVAAAAR